MNEWHQPLFKAKLTLNSSGLDDTRIGAILRDIDEAIKAGTSQQTRAILDDVRTELADLEGEGPTVAMLPVRSARNDINTSLRRLDGGAA